MTSATAMKREAAARAVQAVEPGMTLGLGTGSTVAHFLELLGGRVRAGELPGVVGVPSSIWTEEEAHRLGIPLATLAERPHLDLTVDGADEVTPELDLIKGMGGALLREKIVAQASERFVIIADAGKAVDRLGTRSPLPVEVVAWGWTGHVAELEARGAEVTVRTQEDGEPFVSDNGNLILHCRFPGGIGDARSLDTELHARAGVVETGLFLGMATEAILAGADGVRHLRRER